MRNIDLNQLFIAAPGDQTEYFVRILIQCSVNAAILPEIDVGSGIIISKSAPTDVDKILFNSLRYPELIAQTRSEIPDSTIVCIMSAADLVIDFKTVMGLDTKDLNQIISDFLGMSRMAEFDTFIQQFRTINQKYLSY
jgi:hypothetical protein